MVKMKKFIDKKTGEELLLCPRCKVFMKKLKKNDVIIDVCKKCHGMWVDAGELEKLAKLNK
jgi:Zn-finger nucleic acid-binding protein